MLVPPRRSNHAKTVLSNVLTDTDRVSTGKPQCCPVGAYAEEPCFYAASAMSSEAWAASRRTARLQRTRTDSGLDQCRSAASNPFSSCT